MFTISIIASLPSNTARRNKGKLMATFKNAQIDHDNLPECSVVLFKVGESCPAGYEPCSDAELTNSGCHKLHIAAGYASYGWL